MVDVQKQLEDMLKSLSNPQTSSKEEADAFIKFCCEHDGFQFSYTRMLEFYNYLEESPNCSVELLLSVLSTDLCTANRASLFTNIIEFLNKQLKEKGELNHLLFNEGAYREISLESQQRDTQAKIKELENTLLKYESELRHVQREFITILGIFSAIIFAVVGGMVFGSSVLSHMHEVHLGRLFSVSSFVALILFNVLDYLFFVIFKLQNKKLHEDNKFYLFINLVIFFILIFGIVVELLN